MKIIPLILLSSLAFTAGADDSQSTKPLAHSQDQADTKAIPIKRKQPRYPQNAIAEGYEGWVKLSFVIGTDGKVNNAFVIDSSGLPQFEKSALRALKSWQFTPATADGKTVEQCENSVQMDFTMGKKHPPASKKFKYRYDKTVTALQAKDADASKIMIDKIAAKPRKNSTEEVFFWHLNAHYYGLTGDVSQQLKSYERSAGNIKRSNLEGKVLMPTLEKMFFLQMQTNQLASALNTYNKIAKLKNNDKSLALVAPYKAKIDQLIASDRMLVVPRKVGKRGFARYYLARNSFQFDSVEGDLSKLSIYCDKQHEEFEFSAKNVWTIPQSWGQCSVYVYGDADTSFNIVELPGGVTL